MSLFAELQRRSVFKVGAAYLVVAWLAAQAAGLAFPTFEAPAWALRVFIFVLAVGFPIALVIAWVFDVTPEGLKVEPAPTGNKRMFAIAGAMVVLALVWYRWGMPAGGPGAPAAATDARSIAVLPFVNMSGDAENEYFSDGISEEILNVLARTPELSVAARTSSFQFKGEKRDVAQIATQLKVRMVLEGSVRKQGERVRITAQLIDAQSGFHLWSQTYDRDLKDIFAIQDEIARAIGNELKVRIGGEGAGHSVSGTTDLAAHDHYLRGLTLWQAREEAALFAAIDSYRKALEADPQFAGAWSAMAMVYSVIPFYTNRIEPEASWTLSLDASQRALAIDPTQPEAYMAMGTAAGYMRRRETGVALLRRAVALKPSSATAHQWLGTMLMEIGQPEESLRNLARAAELDPRSLIIASNSASMLSIAGRDEEAIAVCAPTLEFAPDSRLCISVMAVSALLLDDKVRARPYFDRWARNHGPGSERQVIALFDALEGKADPKAFARTIAAFRPRSFRDPNSGNMFGDSDVPVLLMLLDERELALDYIDRNSKDEFVDLNWSVLMPVFDPVRCDPRFAAAVARTGVVDHRAPKVCAGAAPAKVGA